MRVTGDGSFCPVLAMLILTAVPSQRLDWAKKGIVGLG